MIIFVNIFSELQISATWPYMNEELIVESEVYSVLDPFEAPIWTARLITSNKIPCLLSEYMTEFLNICRNTYTTSQILGTRYNIDFEGNIFLFLNEF